MGRSMMVPTERNMLRAKTAPAGVFSTLKAKLANVDLRPPETPEVQQQIAVGGASVTLMDVAVGIVERHIMMSPAADAEELLFVCDCLKADRSKTVLPCGLLIARHDSSDAIDSLLLSTYGDSPTSTFSRCANRKHRADEEEDEEGDYSWQPVAGLCKSSAMELETLLDSSFSSWSFDTFELQRLTRGRPLQFAGWEALRRNSCFSRFEMAPEKAQCFLRRVESGYDHSVPYHNNTHAADVVQAVHSMLSDVGFATYLDPFSCLTLLLSAAVHDMGHDGRNNAFHASMEDVLALTYNDSSILENYHISQAFRILKQEHDANLLSGLDREQFTCARKQMIEAVLGTDMAHHFSKVSGFKQYAQKLNSDAASWLEDAEAAASLRVMILHAADISGPTKTPPLADKWAELLSQEFFAQGDEEKRLQLPVSPMCDRDAVKFAPSQVSFITFIVQPTFQALADVEPRVEADIMSQIEENTALWEARKAEDEGSG